MIEIPATMATQHPDSASKQVTVGEEPQEAAQVLSREGLGLDEYLVDYMSKMTPYHQVKWIIDELHKKTNLVPGRDVFITPRMVSGFADEPFRQLMTFLAILEGISTTMDIFGEQGIIEIAYAVTEGEDDFGKCKSRITRIFSLVGKDLNPKIEKQTLRIMPLLEGIPQQLSSRELISRYAEQLSTTDPLRIFLGNSETSMICGRVASTLSIKIALSDCQRAEEETSIPVFPAIGGGALPFRGHITSSNAENFLKEYSGARTFTIQSGVIYDHGPESTRSLAEKIKNGVHSKAREFNDEERSEILRIMAIFTKNYLEELTEIADSVTRIASTIPNQRERTLEASKVNYYLNLRDIRNFVHLSPDPEIRQRISDLKPESFLNLPRSIKFTAALYTAALPPEFIGTGNAIEELASKMGETYVERLLDDIFPSIGIDLIFASQFLDRDGAENPVMTERIRSGIKALEERFTLQEIDSGYRSLSQLTLSTIFKRAEGKRPARLAVQIYPGEVVEYLDGSDEKNIVKMILDMGKMRRSLG